ncbi:uncharacterized protein LOC131027892 [Cryptomeria japonica]|uniref:uncharacterized protein LOC131027892 n=1 Tax=Cryptomeria japonica TaxID=3369 RepID=UPI0027DA8336|nr:uncharacterized protein LOC131027892 [Cryptomeria japonica]
MVEGIGNLLKLTELYISKCPELEDLPILFGLNSLESITIDSCKKLQSILLPTTLIKLTVRRCRELKMVAGTGNLTKHTDICIGECPELEELPNLARLSCLKRIVIDSCEKLHNIILPTTLIKLTVRRCRELKMVAGTGSLTKLTDICIGECPELKELPIFAGMRFLEMIAIYSCEKLHNIILPTTLIKLTVQNLYRGSQMLTAIENLTELEELSICESTELEELPSFSRLSCLKIIVIYSCEKLHNIILPTTLIKLTVRRCRGLRMVAGIGNLTKLTDICIGECPELEELPILAGLRFLEMIAIYCCEKLHNIILPTTLIKLTVRRYRGLRMIAGIGNLTKLTDICIGECPELKELPILAGQRCLEMIVIDSCKKLHKIILPTTLIKLTVRRCRGLRMVAGNDNLTKLSDICIGECPELEELPILAGLSCLEMIAIYSCDKLHNIILPTTLIKLTVQKLYRGSQMLSAIKNLTGLEELSICESPELEELLRFSKLNRLKMIAINCCDKFHNIRLPTTLIELRVQGCRELSILGRRSCLKSIIFESCQRLDNIQGIRALGSLEAIQFLYCSNAVIHDCIPKLKRVPSTFIQVVGKAADGAKPNLNPGLLSEPYLRHSVICLSPGAIVIDCGVGVVSNSASLHTINESFENSTWKFNLRQGEWIITRISSRQN